MRFLRPIIVVLLVAPCLAPSCNKKTQPSGSGQDMTLDTEIDSVSYGLGVTLAQNLEQQGLDSINVDLMASAIRTSLAGDSTKMALQESGEMINNYMRRKQQQASSGAKEKSEAFLEENAQKENVKVTESGLQYKVLEEGDGVSPDENDKVTVHYEGTLVNGSIFDSSYERGEPASFPVNRVISGWTEALQMMQVGDKWKLFIPPNLAYGERGAGQNIGPNEALIFEVELIDVEKVPNDQNTQPQMNPQGGGGR